METILATATISLCVLDLYMPGLSGIELLQIIKEEYPHVPVIITTGIKNVETAIHCIKQGAFDYLEKPVNIHTLASTIKHCLKIEQLKREQKALLHPAPLPASDLKPFQKIVTSHPAMYRLFHWMEMVAPSAEPVLILGESGAGK